MGGEPTGLELTAPNTTPRGAGRPRVRGLELTAPHPMPQGAGRPRVRGLELTVPHPTPSGGGEAQGDPRATLTRGGGEGGGGEVGTGCDIKQAGEI